MKKLSLEQMEVVEGGVSLNDLAKGYCNGIRVGGLWALAAGVAFSGPAGFFVGASGVACFLSGY